MHWTGWLTSTLCLLCRPKLRFQVRNVSFSELWRVIYIKLVMLWPWLHTGAAGYFTYNFGILLGTVCLYKATL